MNLWINYITAIGTVATFFMAVYIYLQDKLEQKRERLGYYSSINDPYVIYWPKGSDWGRVVYKFIIEWSKWEYSFKISSSGRTLVDYLNPYEWDEREMFFKTRRLWVPAAYAKREDILNIYWAMLEEKWFSIERYLDDKIKLFNCVLWAVIFLFALTLLALVYKRLCL